MKHTALALALCTLICSCNEAPPPSQEADTVIGNTADGVVDANFASAQEDDRFAPPTFLLLEDDTYEKMTNFILKNGSHTLDNDVQYTYWDSLGNRHGMVVIQRPTTGAFEKARPIQISVWVNNPNTDARPEKEFFFYAIHPGDSLVLELQDDRAHQAEITAAINKFLAEKI